MLALLGMYWKQIGVMLLVVAALAYVEGLRLEISHLKTEVASSEAKYNVYKATAETQNAALKADAEAITQRFKDSLTAQIKSEEDKNVAIQQRIKSDKELASIKLSANAVSVFNDGKAASDTVSTAAAKPTDAKAGDQGPTFADLLSKVKENEKNQNECVDALTEWQKFWSAFVTSVQKVGG